MKVLAAIIVFIFIAAYFSSPEWASRLAKKLSRSGKMTIVSALGCLGGVSYASLVYLTVRNPHVSPLAIVVLVAGFMFLSMMGIVSLAFIATIPEQMEKESDSE